MIGRRTLLTGASTCALLARPYIAAAQAVAGKRRVAYLSLVSPSPLSAEFASVLRKLGWIEGSNLILDMRFAQGDSARWAPLTSELLALQPDVFVTTADWMAGLAAAATQTVPIVFVIGNDPVGRGLAKSLSKPGYNVTGTVTLDRELYPKRLELLKEAIPGLRKVGVLTNPGLSRLEYLDDARRRLDLEVVPALIAQPEDIDIAFEKFTKAGVQGVLDTDNSGVVYLARERTAKLAIKHGMAMIAIPAAADSGALLSYGYEPLALLQHAAVLVDRILRGAKPADIPVEQVNVYELVVNLRTARALGIELPRSLMLQATRVIE